MTRYGASVAGVTFLAVVVKDVDYLVVGRRLGSGELGLYTLGFRLPDLAVMGVCYAVSKAVFPAYAKDLVAAFYGPRWAPTGQVLAFIAIYFVASSSSFVVGDLYKATNRTGILNVIALVRLPVSIVALLAVAPQGIVAVAISASATWLATASGAR